MANLKSQFEEAALKLARAKDAANEAQREFDSLYAQIEGKGREKAPVERQPSGGGISVRTEQASAGAAGNYSERIVAVMRTAPKKKWTYAEIAEQVPGIKTASLRPLLSRLARASSPLVVKASRGKYKLAELV